MSHFHLINGDLYLEIKILEGGGVACYHLYSEFMRRANGCHYHVSINDLIEDLSDPHLRKYLAKTALFGSICDLFRTDPSALETMLDRIFGIGLMELLMDIDQAWSLSGESHVAFLTLMSKYLRQVAAENIHVHNASPRPQTGALKRIELLRDHYYSSRPLQFIFEFQRRTGDENTYPPIFDDLLQAAFTLSNSTIKRCKWSDPHFSDETFSTMFLCPSLGELYLYSEDDRYDGYSFPQGQISALQKALLQGDEMEGTVTEMSSKIC